MNRLYLFDFDGVIADSRSVYEHFVIACLEKMDEPLRITADDFLEFFDDNFFESIQKRGIPLDRFLEMGATLNPVDYSQIAVFHDILPVLEELSHRNRLAVISSSLSDPIEAVLNRTQAYHLFSAVLGADYSTSKTEKILHIMEQWKKGPRETFYIGDTTGDIREAKRAGVQSVAVTWGWHPEERLRTADPDHIVRTPRDLLTLNDGAGRP
ncbi:MAG: HAD-IA family hydrolase [Syntrophales bacterium]|jgi:phosphoglycolate phosphatase|nr:HAD-IA family hydrolase [Syntrophales bacterium]MCK9527089.1 HAD-IA family hydrolase [Syntrophales bacterium]MDX9921786.1 HAD-IA family hydrolase [Syntrophales bacterium]